MDEAAITSAPEGAAPVEHASLPEAMTADEGDTAIEKFLSGSTPPKGDHAEEGKAPASGDAPQGDDDELVITSEDDDEPQQTEQASAPAAPVGDDYMVTLQDGQQISLGELKRNNMFHRDYTFKTDGHKKAVSDFEAWKNSEVQRISQQRDQVLAYVQQFMPQPPDPSMRDPRSENYDPIGFMEQQHHYEQIMGHVSHLDQQRQQQIQEMRQRDEQQASQNRAVEMERFFLAHPKLRDKEKQTAFVADVRKILPEVYNLDAEEILQLENSGVMAMVHDVIAYRKALERGKKVREELPGKPKLEGRQRSSPQSQQQRDAQGRFEALRKTGSAEAADRAIEAILSR